MDDAIERLKEITSHRPRCPESGQDMTIADGNSWECRPCNNWKTSPPLGDPTDEELRLGQMMDALDVPEDKEYETCLHCGRIICWCDSYDPEDQDDESTLLLDGDDDASGLDPHKR